MPYIKDEKLLSENESKIPQNQNSFSEQDFLKMGFLKNSFKKKDKKKLVNACK